MKAAVFACAAGAAAAGGSLKLTWEDCGDASTHGKTTSVAPASLTLGQDTDITGAGTTNKAITGGTYDMHLKAGGGLINQHFTGNNCEPKDFHLPLGLGSLSWKGIECPLAAGATELHFGTKLSANLPVSLATSDIGLTAKDQDEQSALCVNLHLAKEQEIAVSAGTLDLTWSDCGDASTHGKTTSVTPASLTLGQDTDITGAGTTNKAITGGTYDMHLKAGGGLINQHFTGNNCEPKDFSLPLGLGSLSWKGIECPLAAGATELHFGTKLSANLPVSLATSDIGLTAKDQDEQSALCVNLHLAKEQEIAVSAGTLGLTWSDCGDASTHGKTTSVTPASLTLGQDTDITGAGTTNKAITGGTYDMHLKAGGGLINQHFTGNNCEPKDFHLPLGLGSLSWKGIECPLAAGATELHFGTKLSANLPVSLATSDIGLTAKDQDEQSALCVNLHLARQHTVILV